MTMISSELSANNVSYVNDVEYSIQVNRWLLKPIGAWPVLSNTAKRERILSTALKVSCYLLIIATIIPSVLFMVFEKTTIQVRLKAIGPMSHWLMGGLNYYFVVLKGNEICRCIQHVKTDWQMVKRTEDRQLMLKTAKVGRSVACLSAFCMHLGVLLYCITCAITKVVIPVGNNTVLVRRVLCPVYTDVIDTRYSPMNEIIIAIQCLLCFVVNSVTVGACGIAAVFAMHACGQLGILMSWMDDLVNEDDAVNKFAQDRLSSIVRHHLRVLSFISCIEETMYQVCLVEIVRCTLNLCMLGYYSMMEWNKETQNLPSYAVLLLSMTFNIFIFCYIGENLMEQCYEVGKRAYMTNWYHLPRKTALCLVLIIARSNVTTKITAGKLIHLSIATFADVIKTAVTYLNMLRTVAV